MMRRWPAYVVEETGELVARPYTFAMTSADDLRQDLERALCSGGPLVVRTRRLTWFLCPPAPLGYIYRDSEP